MAYPTKKGGWVSNNPNSIMGYWPRRDAKLKQGPPKATHKYTTQELIEMKIVGIYLDEDIPEGLKSRRLLTRPEPK